MGRGHLGTCVCLWVDKGSAGEGKSVTYVGTSLGLGYLESVVKCPDGNHWALLRTGIY
jgi:hypothetical protein